MSQPDSTRLVWTPPAPARLPVVLVHGITGCAAVWAPVAERLTALGFTVIAPNLRGHGGNRAPGPFTLDQLAADLVELLEAAGPAYLCGHSLGAAVAWMAAAARPDLVLQFVLEDHHPDRNLNAHTGWREWASAWPHTFASRQEGLDFLAAAGRNAAWWVPSLEEKPDGTWGWSFDFDGVVETARSLGAQDHWDTLARLAMPTLLLRGGRSPHLKADVAERMARAIPHCRLVTFPEADHWVHEDPAPYAEALAEFFLAHKNAGRFPCRRKRTSPGTQP